MRRYTHIGTGNYHVGTVRLFTDFGRFTCNAHLTRDVVNLFHYLTGHSLTLEYASLLVAPSCMRRRFVELVKREIENRRVGRPARIIAKMNQLEDPEMICALLIIRGFCCLRPDVPGRTEGIHVRSVIGRFLEQSRVLYFAAGQENPLEGEFYIGSADWMYRNLSTRVEVITPVLTRPSRKRLWETHDILLRDRRQSWIMNNDGTYTQQQPDPEGEGPECMGTHHVLMELARRAADAGDSAERSME